MSYIYEYICSVCGETFESHETENYHNQIIASGIYQKCPGCNVGLVGIRGKIINTVIL
jgi:DNA-directed RNA polymerase subunit RPC12/RpoP